jgi:hypothetical protein
MVADGWAGARFNNLLCPLHAETDAANRIRPKKTFSRDIAAL